jgi:hypothetical protein
MLLRRFAARSGLVTLRQLFVRRCQNCMAWAASSLGFTLALDHDPREIGLLYYVMASSQTLGDALKRLARYSRITNEALVVGYREGNMLVVNLRYSGVPRHSDRHQIEFCMFGLLRICRMLTGGEPHTATLLDLPSSIRSHPRNGAICRHESGVRR